MSWEDTFAAGRGSFRGATFWIQESRTAFGRRNKIHEYPFRDAP
jgi:prophage DNA circulation protein